MTDLTLLELFRVEAESQTATLAAGILALETGSAAPEQIEELMRAAHSLKGAARIVSLDAAAGLAHVLEDYFVAVQQGRIQPIPAHGDVLLRGVDLLARLARVPETDVAAWLADHEPQFADYVANFEGLLRKAESPTPAEVAPAAVAVLPVELPPAVSRETPPAGRSPQPAAPERVVRVAADSLSRLMGLAGEALVEARQLPSLVRTLQQLKKEQETLAERLQALTAAGGAANDVLDQARHCATVLARKVEDLEDFAHRSEDLSSRLHQEIVQSRLRPLADGIRGFPRMIRDIARELGKEVRFEVRGEQTGVDRDVLDRLEAPLTHLIRNALDHGVEAPDVRRAAGKPPAATITLDAHHRAGLLQITVSDDGRGIDPDQLRHQVVARGQVTAAMAARLSEAELLEFLFLPGFTTKEAVTELSGRGVGLDVVQRTVQALGGGVRVSSEPGRGTRFSLRLPISMSVIRALLVEIAGEPYAFPLPRIDRIEMVTAERLEWLEGRRYYTFEGQPVGLVDAAEVLELPAPTDAGRDALPVVVVSDRGYRFGLVVDRFLGERDLDVRPLDPRLGKVPNLNSASVLEGGMPVLIFDVEDLVRSIDNRVSGRRAHPREAAGRPTRRRVLVVDDSITVRELERQLLQAAGYEVEVAIDGMDGWNAVRSGQFDLVVSDVDMPRLDGIGLVERIKQDPRLRSLPVVIVSYKDRPEDRLRGLDAGADCYLTKSSFHDQTFLAAVHDLIGEV